MGSFTDYLENAFMDHVFNGSTFTPATTIYVALCTADPTDAATGASMNEVANSGSYQRTAITFGAAASRRVTQNADVNFPQATGSWGTVTHWAIVSTQTYGSGFVYAHGAFGTSKNIVSGNTPSIANGEVYVEFSASEISDYAAHAFLDRAFRNQAFALPDNYIALCSAIVVDSDTGSTITEPSGNGYARERIYPLIAGTPDWSAGPNPISNSDNVDFGPATGPWGTLTSVAICDSLTGGNLLAYDNDMGDQTADDGDTIRFAVGDLDVQIS